MSATTQTETFPLEQSAIDAFRRDGFVRIENVLEEDEIRRYHDEALAYSGARRGDRDDPVFHQTVNAWLESAIMKELTFHPKVCSIARQLAGCELRLWHDHILIKYPGPNAAATEFHQDQPYWPHSHSPNPLSAWIALVDVPPERGCMSFIPGSQQRNDLEAQNLRDGRSLFEKAPELEYAPQHTLPLKAGSLTFHHGCCAHRANANQTDLPRVAHVAIYMPEGTRYVERHHIVTDPLALRTGERLDHELFPRI